MAAFDFPATPTVGQVYTANGVTYTWNGYAWVQYVAGPPPLPGGFLNRIFNGAKTVNQRAYAGGALAVGAYGFDRWKGHASGIQQIVEAANLPAGTYTLSWSGGGSGTLASTSGASPLTVALPGGADVSVVVPTTATNIQLESGSVATPFEVRPYPLELLLCQYYFERLTGLLGSGMCISATTVYIAVTCAPKRANITAFTASSAAAVDIYASNGTGFDSASVGGPFNGSNRSFLMVPTLASGLTAGQATMCSVNGGAYIDVNQEL